MFAIAIVTAALGLQPTLSDCTSIRDGTARLACYDEVAGYDAPDGGSASTLVAPPSEVDRQVAMAARAERDGGEPAIVSKVSAIDTDQHGKLTVSLANGQVWRQISSDRSLRINSKRLPSDARITEGAVGSYRLQFNNVRQAIKVRRIQ